MRGPRTLLAALTLSAVCLAVTAPAQAAKRVAAAGDIACEPASPSYNGGKGMPQACRHLDTSNLIVGRRHDAVLILGDGQYADGRLSDYRASYGPTWGRVKSKTRPAVGNHEYGTPGAAGYFDYFNGEGRKRGSAGRRGRGYYSFDLGRWHLIALNSNCDQVGCGADSAQVRWLRRDLARSSSRCALAYMHHPRFSSGWHGDDVRLVPIWRELQRNRVELALAGHEHNYERFAPRLAGGKISKRRGVRQLIAGTGGHSVRPLGDAEPGSRRRLAGIFGILDLRLERRSYKWGFRTVTPFGSVMDRGSSRCR